MHTDEGSLGNISLAGMSELVLSGFSSLGLVTVNRSDQQQSRWDPELVFTSGRETRLG